MKLVKVEGQSKMIKRYDVKLDEMIEASQSDYDLLYEKLEIMRILMKIYNLEELKKINLFMLNLR